MLQQSEDEEEERKSEDEGSCLRDPISIRWAKDALNIVTQHLGESQKISLLSE